MLDITDHLKQPVYMQMHGGSICEVVVVVLSSALANLRLLAYSNSAMMVSGGPIVVPHVPYDLHVLCLASSDAWDAAAIDRYSWLGSSVIR